MSNAITWSDPPYTLPFQDYYIHVFNRTGSSQHLTGGNPILSLADGGVVDTNLLVYGTRNVRIVDGSVFPYQPSAHPMGLTYALAVKAAKILERRPGLRGLTETEMLYRNGSARETASWGGGTAMVPVETPGSVAPASATAEGNEVVSATGSSAGGGATASMSGGSASPTASMAATSGASVSLQGGGKLLGLLLFVSVGLLLGAS